MSDRTVTVTVPDWFPTDIAQSNFEQSLVEALVWEGIILHFDKAKESLSLKESLDVINRFSDETLWRILDYRIPYAKRYRQRELVTKGSLSVEEQGELQEYTGIYDRFVATRAKAILLLKQRGHDVERYLEEQS